MDDQDFLLSFFPPFFRLRRHALYEFHESLLMISTKGKEKEKEGYNNTLLFRQFTVLYSMRRDGTPFLEFILDGQRPGTTMHCSTTQ